MEAYAYAWEDLERSAPDCFYLICTATNSILVPYPLVPTGLDEKKKVNIMKAEVKLPIRKAIDKHGAIGIRRSVRVAFHLRYAGDRTLHERLEPDGCQH